mgnify:CR=1 FL=1
MKKLTFKDITQQTLEKVGKPLSAREIWNKANELGITKDFTTTGKTPWSTIGAYCYTDIENNGPSSTFIQINKRPATFFLRNLTNNKAIDTDNDINIVEEIEDAKINFQNQNKTNTEKGSIFLIGDRLESHRQKMIVQRRWRPPIEKHLRVCSAQCF